MQRIERIKTETRATATRQGHELSHFHTYEGGHLARANCMYCPAFAVIEPLDGGAIIKDYGFGEACERDHYKRETSRHHSNEPNPHKDAIQSPMFRRA